MTDYNGYEDNFDYLPDVINPHEDNSENTPEQDKRTMKMGKENHPGFWQGDDEDDGVHMNPYDTYYLSPGTSNHYLDIPESKEKNTDTWPDNEDPEDWEKKFRESMRRKALAENDILEESNDQLKRGQMGIMDEDSHQGDIGSPLISTSNKPSTKSYIRCDSCRRREEPSNPKFASWWNDGTGFPPYYCPTCVDKGEVPTQQKQSSSVQTWYPFYSAVVGDDDNPGYETDPQHGVSGRDTDDVEEDADSDYGGKRKRRNSLSDSNSATLVAMGGIGAIPEGFHGDDDVHYGDESFSHEQSNSPSQTGISGENSKDFGSFDKEWNS